MSAIVATHVYNRTSLIRSIAIVGLIIGTLHLIDDFVFFGLVGKNPVIQIGQYMASGALGTSAFAGGLAIGLLGVIIYYGVSFVIAGVFILSATQLPVLRRNAILAGLL